MFIHLGGDWTVWTRDVVAILDEKLISASKRTREFVETHQVRGRYVAVAADAVKSYVVTTDALYGSPISSTTLMRRALGVRASDVGARRPMRPKGTDESEGEAR
ncbi:extracellular matrix regulator RemB [Calditerricola satsumensis]|uniref:DUF370 domain-containing protein n=1 Tax=Calditerricola satsumensis TaxID=373054 RepID=A0A8J3FAE3_9BACI|nr:extracellular matrix/biofilm biosynthesis regulator RemA family protein [Calditerricola satsumensis]GGJ97382.1 hypothetical protein GCM10007043_09070 [Calditerricola satsumensis]